MPRRPRLQVAGAVYHVMARGNRKSTIFHDDEDRQRFLVIIADAAAAYDLRVLAFCLMGNHYHVVLETPRRNLSDAMQFINGVFAQRSNRRHRQTGHVFEGRFRSLIIERESYLTRATRYVVRNPVRAYLVTGAAAWPWSSYGATAGLTPLPSWLHVEWIKWAFKADTLAEAQQRYTEYVNAPTEPRPRIDLNANVLGTRRFKASLLEAVRAGHGDRLIPFDAQELSRPPLTALFDKESDESAGRDRLIQVARTEHGYRLAEIARFLGIDRSTASRAVTRWQQKNAAGLDGEAG